MPSPACRATAAANATARRAATLAGGESDRAKGLNDRQRQKRIGDHPMLELHHGDIVDEIAPEGAQRHQHVMGRHEMAVHQRPGVIGAPGAQTGDKRAEKNLQEGEGYDRQRQAALPRRGFSAVRGASEDAIQTIAAKVSEARRR